MRALRGLRLLPGRLLSQAAPVCVLYAGLLLARRLLPQAVRLLLAAVLSLLVHVRTGTLLSEPTVRTIGNRTEERGDGSSLAS